MTQENQSEDKKCPFCAEPIKEAAIKCKHCGEWLEDEKRKEKGKGVEKETEHFSTVKGESIITAHADSWSDCSGVSCSCLALVCSFILIWIAGDTNDEAIFFAAGLFLILISGGIIIVYYIAKITSELLLIDLFSKTDAHNKVGCIVFLIPLIIAILFIVGYFS